MEILALFIIAVMMLPIWLPMVLTMALLAWSFFLILLSLYMAFWFITIPITLCILLI